jgi:hypothetical protein
VPWKAPKIRELTPVSVVAIIAVLTILTLVITGTVEVEIVADGITGRMEILATAIADTKIGTQEDEMEEIEVAEVAEDAEDVAEEMEIDPKATMHAQFMVDTSGVSVFLTLTETIIDRGTVTVLEMARVEEMAQGGATPTMQIMRIMVAILMEVKEMAPTAAITTLTTRTITIVEVETAITTIETTVTTIIWRILECPIGIRNDYLWKPRVKMWKVKYMFVRMILFVKNCM